MPIKDYRNSIKDYIGEGIVHCTYCGEKINTNFKHSCFPLERERRLKEIKEVVPCGFCGEEVKFGSLHNCDEKQNYIKYLNIEYQEERRKLWEEHNIKGEDMKDNGIMCNKDFNLNAPSVRDLNEEEIDLTESQKEIIACMDSIKEFILEKNRRYGDSALHPKRIFSKATTDEQIRIRLDDKLSRIENSTELRKNDILDTIGYLVLFAVSKKWTDFTDLLD